MEGTTNINQLPSDNMYSENIVIATQESTNQQQMPQQQQQQQQPQQQMQQMQQQQPQQMQQQPQMQQQQQMPQQMPQQQPMQGPQGVGGAGAGGFSRPSSPQINYSNNNDPSLVQHLAGIQETNMLNNGMELPSRDIPTNTNHFSQDQQTNPNWVPQDQPTNYINNQVTQDMINQYSNQQNNFLNNNDYLYDQLKVPLIISILFFIYSFSTFDKSLLNHLPFLFTQDQNIKKSGLFVKSILFGLGYFAINKGIDHFSKI